LAMAHRPNTRSETFPLSSSSRCSCRLSLLIFAYSSRTAGSAPSRVWTNSSSVISSAPVTPSFLFDERATLKISPSWCLRSAAPMRLRLR
jgi:hypothetical protein